MRRFAWKALLLRREKSGEGKYVARRRGFTRGSRRNCRGTSDARIGEKGGKGAGKGNITNATRKMGSPLSGGGTNSNDGLREKEKEGHHPVAAERKAKMHGEKTSSC